MSPIQFARITCDDLGLPLSFVRLIAASMVDQIDDFYSSMYGTDEENVETSASLRHSFAIRNMELDETLDLKTDFFASKTELRIFIKVSRRKRIVCYIFNNVT